jgi:hypothetical protein
MMSSFISADNVTADSWYSGNVDTAVQPTFLRVFEAIFAKALTKYQGHRRLYDEKKQGRKSCAEVRVPLTQKKMD